MKLIKSLLVLLTFTFFMISCGEDSGLSITMTSPSDNSVFAPGDIITVSGTATDDIEISSFQIESSGLDLNETVNGTGTAVTPFNFTVTLREDTTPVDDVAIKVTAFDNDGNSVTEERNISVQ